MNLMTDGLVPWPEHMWDVFREVGGLIKGKQLRPEHVSALQPNDRTIVPEHKVTVSHIPKTEIGEKQGRYVVVIEGPRISGTWTLLPGTMDRLSREAASASNVR